MKHQAARVVLIGLSAATVVLLAMAPVAHALSVQVTTVQASLEGPSDAQLLPFRPRLRRWFGRRRSFLLSRFIAFLWRRGLRFFFFGRSRLFRFRLLFLFRRSFGYSLF